MHAVRSDHRDVCRHRASDSGRSCTRGWRVFATMRNLQKRSLLEQALKEAGVGAFARLNHFLRGKITGLDVAPK